MPINQVTSYNFPPGPHLVVKTHGLSAQAAIELADELATAMLRRPIDQLHRQVDHIEARARPHFEERDRAEMHVIAEVHYREQP